MKEKWKFVDETDNKYKISTLGNVKRKIYVPKTKSYKWIGLHQTEQDGYKIVLMWFIKNKERFNVAMRVHRLVGFAFIPNPENKTQINHKNMIRHDNRLENLEWVTPRENVIHGYKMRELLKNSI